MNQNTAALYTNSRMWAIWPKDLGSGINSYQDWEDTFPDDAAFRSLVLERRFVPINLNSDGVLGFMVRIGADAALTPREQPFAVVTSNQYDIRSKGILCISGVEFIEENPNPDHVLTIEVPAGDYEATAVIIEWKAEPGALNADNTPSSTALPDIIVLLKPAPVNEKPVYSDSLETFRKQ